MFAGVKRAARWTVAALIVFAAAQGIPALAQNQPAAGAPKPAGPTPTPVDLNLLVGEWTTALEGLPGGPQLGTTTIVKNGDKFTGSLKSALGELKAESIKASGPNAIITVSIEMMNNPSEIELSVKPDKDKFTGTFSAGGGMMSGGFRGAKVGTEAEKALKAEVEAKIKELIGEPVLPIEDAKDFKGEWTFSGDSPMGPVNVDFELKDVNGKASGMLKLPPPLGTYTMNKIEKTPKGIAMKQKMDLMGSETEMVVDLEREGPMISGMLDIGSGMVSVPLEGLKKGRAMTKVAVAGKNVMIEYGRPSTEGAGYKQLASVKPDQIWRMGKNEATNIKTDADIKAGDKTIKAGRYSLWAKKTADGWNLVFNNDADVWGTNHKASSDIGEIPLTMSKPASPAQLLTIELKADSSTPNGVNYRLSWGDQEATAKFTLDVPPPPAAPAGGAAAPKPAAGK